MITVIVVDDHPIVRAGLKTVLDSAPDIHLSAEGSGGQEALRLVEALQPDVLVLDLNLPDLNGLDVARRLCEAETRTAILMLTIYQEEAFVFEALECGISGYLLKDEALETLVSAVRAVARGETWLSPSVATRVVQRAVSHPPAPKGGPPARNALAGLTRREIEVLKLIGEGLDNSAIALRLSLTTRTVQNHVSTIYGKLGVSSRMEAAFQAIRCGLVPGPQPDV
jgi:two-component system NarL family response regulator